MSFGIGLGAFVRGVNTGIDIRNKIDAGREYRDNKKRLDAIDTDTRQQFDSQVSAGAQSPENYEKFWLEYALPRRRNELLRQGDVAGAQALQKWGESSAAKKGGKLFSSALLKAQTGDPGGAIDDAIEAAQVKGYLEHGYELVGKEEIKGDDGKVVGYRLKIKTAEGDEVEQDVAVNDIAKVVSTLANPDAAWASQLENRKTEEARAHDSAKTADKRRHEAKKDERDHQQSIELQKIKTGAKNSGVGAYNKAFEARLENDFDFQRKTKEEQDAIVRDDLKRAKDYAASERRGQAPGISGAAPQPGRTGRRIKVDTRTGEIVPEPDRSTPKGSRVKRAPGINVDPEELRQ